MILQRLTTAFRKQDWFTTYHEKAKYGRAVGGRMSSGG